MTVDDLIHHYRRGNLDSVLFSTDTMLFPTLNLKSNNKEGELDRPFYSVLATKQF